MSAKAETLYPEPLSPTTARVLPASKSNETPFTAVLVLSRSWKVMTRSLTESRGIVSLCFELLLPELQRDRRLLDRGGPRKTRHLDHSESRVQDVICRSAHK